MSDLSSVIEPKSDQLNGDDLISGPRIITITGVKVRPGVEQPVTISFEGDGGKPYKPCKTMSRLMSQMWGPDSSTFAGKSLRLFRDPAVKWAGLATGGIRISGMSDIDGDQKVVVHEAKGRYKGYEIEALRSQPRQQPKPSDANRAKAETWVEGHIGIINTAADFGAMNAEITKQARVLTKLAKDHPDLHKLAIDAHEAKGREMSGEADGEDGE